MGKEIKSYKDLIVWQKAVELSINTYKLTEQFPKEEIYGLSSQLRRSAVSIPSNIAEGRCRNTRKDFINFLSIAYASGDELETQILIAKQLKKTKYLDYSHIEVLLNEVMKMLNVLMHNLKNSQPNP